jgi:CubicO group peptidase (beta-lactamase class C family)
MRPLRILVLALVLGAGYWLVDHWLFIKRYATYIASGYDAHTAAIDWFEPLYPLPHGMGSVLPVADPPTIPGRVLDEVLAYAESQDSMALIIARDGRLEVEKYWGGYTRESLFNPQSMSKTVVAMTTGIALAEGAIGSLDDPIGSYLDEWRDDPRGDITIRHLLQMSGGLAQISTDYRPVPWSRGVWQHFGVDFNGPILDLALADAPGTRFDYNNNENNLLGLVLERATGLPYQAYMGKHLWAAADLAPAFMYLDRPGGNVMKSCCIMSRPIDWVKLGQLLLDDGRLDGQQILPPGWAAQMMQPADTWDGYGYQLWLKVGVTGEASAEPPASPQAWWASEPFAREDVVQFLGHGFQHVWVIPGLQMVIVRANRVWPREPWDQSRIPNLLIRGLQAGSAAAP